METSMSLSAIGFLFLHHSNPILRIPFLDQPFATRSLTLSGLQELEGGIHIDSRLGRIEEDMTSLTAEK